MKDDGFEFGYLLHVALRKGVDTKWSVVLWNYIHQLIAMDGDADKRTRVWQNFCEFGDIEWKKDYTVPAYEIIKRWIESRGLWHEDSSKHLQLTERYYTFEAMWELVDEETIQQLNDTMEYYVKNY